MKRKTFLVKQGLLFKFISIFFQNLIISPVLFFIAFIITTIIISFYSVESVLILKIVFLLLNIIWVIRNSFLLLYDDKIILRTWIGTKQIIELDNITSLKMIDYKELRRMIFESNATNPLITNAFAILIPLGKFITFKNKFGRDVVIGVWNSKKLYNLLNENALQNSVSERDSVEKTEKADYDSTNACSDNIRCYVKMPLYSHILFYFRHFGETIILPAFKVAVLKWLMNANGIVLDNYIFIILFAVLSMFNYYNVIRVVVNPNLNTIRLHLFYNNNKNVIRYKNLVDLKYVDSVEILNSLEKDQSKFLICTPHYKNNLADLITFDLENNVRVILSVNKSREVYQLLSFDEHNKF